MDPLSSDTVRCPTCRAAQPWSDACRRCKSDLRLLREAAEEYAALRAGCLSKLRHNQLAAALERARQCVALHDDVSSRRLLAVCELVNGNWTAARARARQVLAGGEGERR